MLLCYDKWLAPVFSEKEVKLSAASSRTSKTPPQYTHGSHDHDNVQHQHRHHYHHHYYYQDHYHHNRHYHIIIIIFHHHHERFNTNERSTLIHFTLMFLWGVSEPPSITSPKFNEDFSISTSNSPDVALVDGIVAEDAVVAKSLVSITYCVNIILALSTRAELDDVVEVGVPFWKNNKWTEFQQIIKTYTYHYVTLYQHCENVSSKMS